LGKAGDMATIHDLIEDWIQIRSTLQRQLKQLESGDINPDLMVPKDAGETAAIRVRKCVEELNALLKEYSGADRT
jgi:hypothetical protein